MTSALDFKPRHDTHDKLSRRGDTGLVQGRFRAPAGENCLAPRGAYFPIIDRNRCEGGGECSRVCPESVFEVRTIDGQDHDQLSFMGRMRSALHGRKSAYTPNAGNCQACGLCVDACPEQAISLVTFG